MTKSHTQREYEIGGLVDESVPELTRPLQGTKVDAKALSAWLAPRLGHYRAMSDAASERVSRAEQLAELDKLIRALGDAKELLRDGAYPAETRGWLDLEAHRLRHNRYWKELATHLRVQLDEAQACAAAARDQIDERNGRRGRPTTMALRDALLKALIDQLHGEGLSLRRARTIASDVLRLCCVPVPADERELRRKGGAK